MTKKPNSMKKPTILLLLLLFLFSCLFAQTEYLVEIDYENGSFSKVDSIAGVKTILLEPNFTTFDENNQYFIFGGSYKNVFKVKYPDDVILYTMDANSGKIIYQSPFPKFSDPDDRIIELQYSNSNRALYGLYYDAPDKIHYLISVDNETGEFDIINSLPDVNQIKYNCSTFYETNNNYLFYGRDSNNKWYVYFIDIISGSISRKTAFPNEFEICLRLYCDNSTSMVYGVNERSNPLTYYLTSMDFNGDNFISRPLEAKFIEDTAFDQNSHCMFIRGMNYYYGGNSYLYAIDLNTGNCNSKKLFPCQADNKTYPLLGSDGKRARNYMLEVFCNDENQLICIEKKEINGNVRYLSSIDISCGTYNRKDELFVIREQDTNKEFYTTDGSTIVCSGYDYMKYGGLSILQISIDGHVYHSIPYPELEDKSDEIKGFQFEAMSQKLYGIYFDMSDSELYFIDIDLETGSLHKINKLIDVGFDSTIESVLDIKNQQFIFQGNASYDDQYLYSVDLNTGEITSSVLLSNINASTDRLDGLRFHKQTSTLYGIFESPVIDEDGYWTENRYYLKSIDIISGNSMVIESMLEYPGINKLNLNINEYTGCFVFREFDKDDGYTYLNSVDISTGNVVSRSRYNLIPELDDNILELQYSNTQNKLLGLHWDDFSNKPTALCKHYTLELPQNKIATIT